MSSGPLSLEIAEGLRLLERRVASVYTLMKASVYSIVLQQGHMDAGDEHENYAR
jgi:DASH complex subunit DAD3